MDKGFEQKLEYKSEQFYSTFLNQFKQQNKDPSINQWLGTINPENTIKYYRYQNVQNFEEVGQLCKQWNHTQIILLEGDWKFFGFEQVEQWHIIFSSSFFLSKVDPKSQAMDICQNYPFLQFFVENLKNNDPNQNHYRTLFDKHPIQQYTILVKNVQKYDLNKPVFSNFFSFRPIYMENGMCYTKQLIMLQILAVFNSFYSIKKQSTKEFNITTGFIGCGYYQNNYVLMALIQFLIADLVGIQHISFQVHNKLEDARCAESIYNLIKKTFNQVPPNLENILNYLDSINFQPSFLIYPEGFRPDKLQDIYAKAQANLFILNGEEKKKQLYPDLLQNHPNIASNDKNQQQLILEDYKQPQYPFLQQPINLQQNDHLPKQPSNNEVNDEVNRLINQQPQYMIGKKQEEMNFNQQPAGNLQNNFQWQQQHQQQQNIHQQQQQQQQQQPQQKQQYPQQQQQQQQNQYQPQFQNQNYNYNQNQQQYLHQQQQVVQQNQFPYQDQKINQNLQNDDFNMLANLNIQQQQKSQLPKQDQQFIHFNKLNDDLKYSINTNFNVSKLVNTYQHQKQQHLQKPDQHAPLVGDQGLNYNVQDNYGLSANLTNPENQIIIALDELLKRKINNLHPYKQLLYNKFQHIELFNTDVEMFILRCVEDTIYPPGALLIQQYNQPKTQFVSKMQAYDYKDIPNSFQWFINFADKELFGFYYSSLFAQDEIQTVEHPLLYHAREEIVYQSKTIKPKVKPLTIEQNNPTPILIVNAFREGIVNTDPYPGNPSGLYGNNFSKAPQKDIEEQSKQILVNEMTQGNFIAMCSLQHGKGFYTLDEIQFTFKTAFKSFREGYCIAKMFNAETQTIINTGNWGCGAFGNNLEMISVIQILAAEVAQIDVLVYHTFKKQGQDAYNKGKQVYTSLRENIIKLQKPKSYEEYVSHFLRKIHEQKYVWSVSDGN